MKNLVITDYGSGSIPLNTICASNEGRFDQTFLSEPLTTYAVGGWDKNELQPLLEFIAPKCEVSRKFSYYEFDNSDDFNADDGNQDVRAIGSNFARVQGEQKTVHHDVTQNKGLTIALDKDEVAADPKKKMRAIKRIQQRLIRNELRRAYALMLAGAISARKTWDSTSNPDRDVKDALLTAYSGSGVRPNRVLFGLSSWSLRDAAYAAQNTAGGFAALNKDISKLTADYAAQVMTADALARDSDGNLQKMFDGGVLLFNAVSGAEAEDPSNIKRFVSEGGSMSVYEHETVKTVEISVEHYSKIVLTSTLGLYQLNIS